MVYEDIYDAKNALDHLSGFNVCGRYLVVIYFKPERMQQRIDNEREKRELEEMKAKFGFNKEKDSA